MTVKGVKSIKLLRIAEPPVANFTGAPTTGDSPLSVQFTDQSTGSITSYSWDFGDSGISTQQNPAHTYTTAGTYSMNLTVTGPGGSNSKIRTNYISVNTPPILPYQTSQEHRRPATPRYQSSSVTSPRVPLHPIHGTSGIPGPQHYKIQLTPITQPEPTA